MKNCPNCGAPIKHGQYICEYCGSEIEGERPYENNSGPIAPYGGKIGTVIRIRHDIVEKLNDEQLLDYCKHEFYKVFEDEIKKHIKIRFRKNPFFADIYYPIEAKGEIELFPIDESHNIFDDIQIAQVLTEYR